MTKTLLRYFYPGTAWHMHTNWDREDGDLSALGKERYYHWIVTHAPKLTALRWVMRESIRRNNVIFMLEAEKHGSPGPHEFVRWRLSHAVRAKCGRGSGLRRRLNSKTDQHLLTFAHRLFFVDDRYLR